MRITKLALGTLTALCLSLPGGCDDATKDAAKVAAKDGKTEAKKDLKAADAKAADAKAADAKAADAKADIEGDVAAADAKAAEAKADAGAGGDVATAKVGVVECDEYIAKMTACIASGSVAAEQVEAQKMGLEMYAKSWADAMTSNPTGGPSLVPGCKAAIEMGKVSHPSCFESK